MSDTIVLGQVVNKFTNYDVGEANIGKTIWEVFSEVMGAELSRKEAETHFNPLVNGKSTDWDTVLDLGDQLSLLPHIAGGQ